MNKYKTVSWSSHVFNDNLYTWKDYLYTETEPLNFIGFFFVFLLLLFLFVFFVFFWGGGFVSGRRAELLLVMFHWLSLNAAVAVFLK